MGLWILPKIKGMGFITASSFFFSGKKSFSRLAKQKKWAKNIINRQGYDPNKYKDLDTMKTRGKLSRQSTLQRNLALTREKSDEPLNTDGTFEFDVEEEGFSIQDLHTKFHPPSVEIMKEATCNKYLNYFPAKFTY